MGDNEKYVRLSTTEVKQLACQCFDAGQRGIDKADFVIDIMTSSDLNWRTPRKMPEGKLSDDEESVKFGKKEIPLTEVLNAKDTFLNGERVNATEKSSAEAKEIASEHGKFVIGSKAGAYTYIDGNFWTPARVLSAKDALELTDEEITTLEALPKPVWANK